MFYDAILNGMVYYTDQKRKRKLYKPKFTLESIKIQAKVKPKSKHCKQGICLYNGYSAIKVCVYMCECK